MDRHVESLPRRPAMTQESREYFAAYGTWPHSALALIRDLTCLALALGPWDAASMQGGIAFYVFDGGQKRRADDGECGREEPPDRIVGPPGHGGRGSATRSRRLSTAAISRDIIWWRPRPSAFPTGAPGRSNSNGVLLGGSGPSPPPTAVRTTQARLWSWGDSSTHPAAPSAPRALGARLSLTLPTTDEGPQRRPARRSTPTRAKPPRLRLHRVVGGRTTTAGTHFGGVNSKSRNSIDTLSLSFPPCRRSGYLYKGIMQS